MSNARMEDTIQDVTLVTLRYQITEETDLDALHDQIDIDLGVTPVSNIIAPIYDDECGAPGLEFGPLSANTGTVRVLDSDGVVMDSCSLPAVLHVPTWVPRNGSFLSN